VVACFLPLQKVFFFFVTEKEYSGNMVAYCKHDILIFDVSCGH
jgi:hypothetical protein